MIDIKREKLITPDEYAAMRPPRKDGRSMSPMTAKRHMTRGVHGIKLEHVRVGLDIYTSVEAVQRFVDRLAALSAEPGGSKPRSTKRSPTSAKTAGRGKAKKGGV